MLNMKLTNTQFKELSFDQLFNKIDWFKAIGHYVIVDPNVSDHLLYITESKYQKLLTSRKEDEGLKVLACPGDTKAEVSNRLGLDGSKQQPQTPHINQWMSCNSKLFTLISGWIVKDSMINFKRNFEMFFPIYYSSILNWLGLKRNPQGYRGIWKFGIHFSKLKDTRGINQVILILKIASIAINQYIAGTPLKSTQDLGQRIRLINGLPAFLPVYIRSLIRSGNVNYIRVVTTLMASYKGFAGVWKPPAFDTIQSPRYERPIWMDSTGKIKISVSALFGKENISSLPSSIEFGEDWTEVNKTTPAFWNWFNPSRISPQLQIDFEKPPVILTAGPNSSTSMLGITFDALMHYYKWSTPLFQFEESPLYRYAKAIQSWELRNNISPCFTIWQVMENMLRPTLLQLAKGKYPFSEFEKLSIHKAWLQTDQYNLVSPESGLLNLKDFLSNILPYLRLGKLAIKLEPAGKVRVFAISDYWTQWALSPLHNSIFKLLEKHPCDATFDQTGKVTEFSKKNYSYVASYDLKSATDLIPIQLYEKVFSYWLGPEVASAWLNLLTNRDYIYFHASEGKSKVPKDYRYTRGQPMGTLSSWAGLAVVHHYLVFLAASRVAYNNFTDYLVLGDDIVIANPEVAQSYKLVCEEYGITIGLPKSFVSNKGFFQFASQDMLGDTNFSPISLREVLAAAGHSYHFGPNFNLMKRLEFVNRNVKKGFINPSSLISIIRAQTTLPEWKRYSKQFSKGIIPSELQGLITSFLLNNYKSTSKNISLVNLIASLRGDYGILTNSVKLDPLFYREYLTKIYEYLLLDIDTRIKEVARGMVSQPLQTKDVTLTNMYANIMMSYNSSVAESYMKLYMQHKEISTRIYSDLELDKWFHLYDPSSQPALWPQDLIILLDMRSDLELVLSKLSVQRAIVHSFNTKVNFLMKFHLSLIASLSYRNLGAFASSGGL